MRKTRWLIVSVVAVAVLAIGARVMLPSIVERYANRQLADMGEYRGSVQNVDVALLRGAYTVYDLTIVKVGSRAEPFLRLPKMDVSVEWNALLDGELVGEMIMDGPRLNLIQGETERDTQLGMGVSWPAEVREFFPFRFNVVEVRNATVTFRAPGIEADESLTAQKLSVVLRDLTNVQERRDPAFATMRVEGAIMGDAPLSITGRMDPNESRPTFDFNLSLEGADLVDVNPWLSQFLHVDAQAGEFSMYAEVAAAEGRFQGYVKPIIEHPDIFRLDEESSGPFRKAWEALVELGTKLLENPAEDQIATEVPLSGELENPKADLLETMVNLMRNAFVSAFSHSLEGTVGLGDVIPGSAADDEAADSPKDERGDDERRDRRARDEDEDPEPGGEPALPADEDP